MVDLMRAINMPQGWVFPDGEGGVAPRPRRFWGHVFGQTSDAVWAWVRPASGATRIEAVAWSGAHGMRIATDAGPDGVFFIAAMMERSWPSWVLLSEPGWVDFGRGLPPAWLDQPRRHTIDLEHLEAINPFDPLVEVFINETRRRDRGDPATLRDRIRALVGPALWDRMVASYAEARTRPVPGLTYGPEDPRPPATAEGRRLLQRHLREARRISQADAGLAATEILASSLATIRFSGEAASSLTAGSASVSGEGSALKPVSMYQVFHYERGRTSRVKRLAAALDMVVGGFGWTCYEPVRPVRLRPGLVEIPFPAWWIGPVSVTLRAAGARPARGPVVFTHVGQWTWTRPAPEHPQRPGDPDAPGHQSITYTFQRTPDATPLQVQTPAGWRVQAHMGLSPEAIDAAHDWVPATEEATEVIYRAYSEIHLRVLGKTWNDLESALGIRRR